MTPEFREELRKGILLVLEETGSRFGRPVAAVEVHLRSRGFLPSRAELDAELLYLEGKELVEQAAKTISPEVPRFRITAQGRDFLATN